MLEFLQIKCNKIQAPCLNWQNINHQLIKQKTIYLTITVLEYAGNRQVAFR